MKLNWRLGFLTVCSLLTAAPFPKYVDLGKDNMFLKESFFIWMLIGSNIGPYLMSCVK